MGAILARAHARRCQKTPSRILATLARSWSPAKRTTPPRAVAELVRGLELLLEVLDEVEADVSHGTHGVTGRCAVCVAVHVCLKLLLGAGVSLTHLARGLELARALEGVEVRHARPARRS